MTILKAELHTHLEGTIHPRTALNLAQRNRVTVDSERISKDGNSYLFKDFLDFIHTYDNVISPVIKQPRDYYDVTFDYLERNAKAGAIYIEMMYSPELAENNTGIPSNEHLSAIQTAIDDAEAQFGIVGRILMTALRHHGAQATVEVAKYTLKNTFPCVVGFGLAGDEINYPPQWFKDAFDMVHAGGYACTIHAGEFGSAESMILAMDTLPIQRIGHGVAAVNNPEAIARLKDKNILLEVCPASNIKLGLFQDLSSHPLPKLVEAGVKVCLNTDDPPYFMSELPQEYEEVQRVFQFSDETMLTFTRNAIEAAFLDQATKNKLLKRLP